jgi:hypothetical protein
LLRHVFALCRSHSRKTFSFGYKITALVCVGQYLKKGILFSCSLHISKAFLYLCNDKTSGLTITSQSYNGIKMMKRDLTALVKAVEKKFGQSVTMATDFEKLAFAFAKQHVALQPTMLKKLWAQITGAEKPSVELLDKVALFVGFQSWKDFKDALHGDDDGQTNYEV